MRTVLTACGLALLMLTAGSPARTPAVADETGQCTGPADSAMKLPVPLSKWARLVCTPYGQIITGREGWVWIEPVHLAYVVIPSQPFDERAKPANEKARFTKIAVKKIDGAEFDKVYGVLQAGLGLKDPKPMGYRLDLATAMGETLQLYFFDYLTYGWGISCPSGKCDQNSRFMMLNVKTQQPSI